VGTPVIYTSQSPSLAALEILVHYDVLPKDFVMTPVEIPDRVRILALKEVDLPRSWARAKPVPATQNLAEKWIREAQSAVLAVPSSVVRSERNFVLNPAHPDFRLLRFRPSTPFRFDPRLIK
jgi:RES domain-containing protein